MKKILYIIALFIALVACESEPSDLLSKGQMEDLLYDIHLAQNAVGNEPTYEKRSAKEITLRKSVMDKHGVSQAQWDSSFNYYCRHTEELYDIYENISERLRQNVVDIGGDVESDMALAGDTSNIWTAERSFVMMQYPPYNMRAYTLEADTSYQAGDILTLSFRTDFIFEDGMRDVVCVFTMTLDNDSVVHEERHCSSSDNVTKITIQDKEGIGIKNVRLYFMMSKSWSEPYSSTLRLVSISDIKLIRSHCDKEKMEKDKAQRDSIQARRDSVEESSEYEIKMVPVEDDKELLDRPRRPLRLHRDAGPASLR